MATVPTLAMVEAIAPVPEIPEARRFNLQGHSPHVLNRHGQIRRALNHRAPIPAIGHGLHNGGSVHPFGRRITSVPTIASGCNGTTIAISDTST